ncbi:hypothetical protein CHS0354_037259 [Potamilus streckersoni]|uniref:Methyltransferase domain-containing protein n=1 Tax=Potamilus streckersoni TaxID=2493646 RepID=A0AAE0W2L0_9BIVA|nr:hypothetical protein CHS0354_037259 [Potamilus streckersoni]
MGAADFDNICLFLAQFQWVYNFRLTHFFIDEVWKHVPEEWTEYLLSMTVEELNQVPSGKLKEGCPESFHTFVKKSLLYSSICTHAVSTIDNLDQNCINSKIKRGMTPKKLHEVCHMTSLVDHVTRESGSEVVVDVGSGLGYLGQVLHDVFHYPVLGLESQSGHTSGAEQRTTHCGGHTSGAEQRTRHSGGHTSGAEQRTRHSDKCHFLRNSTYELRCDPESQQHLQTLLIDWFSRFDTEQCDCHFNAGSSKEKSSWSFKEVKAQSNQEQYDCDPNFIPSLSNLFQSKEEAAGIKENDSSSVSHTVNSSAETLMPLAKFTQNREKFKISRKDTVYNKCHGNVSSEIICDRHLVNSHENTKTLVNEEYIKSIPVTCDIDGNEECIKSIPVTCDIDGNECIKSIPVTCDIDGNEECIKSIPVTCDIDGNEECTKSIPVTCDIDGNEECIKSIPVTCDIDGNEECIKSIPVTCDIDGNEECTKSIPVTCDIDGNEECIKSIPVTCDGNDLAASKRIDRKIVDDGTVLGRNDKDNNNTVESKDGSHAYYNIYKGLPINNITKTMLVMPKICMIGLHCCGDLTPAMLKCFANEDFVRALCCVSCCYHRMNYDESLKEFSMFPMSAALETAMNKTRERFPGWSIGTYGLRLAAQETRTRWEKQTSDDHTLHIKNVAYRALLQLCVTKCGLVLKKSVRKIAHRADFSTFDNYVSAVTKHIQTEDAHTLQTFKEELSHLHGQYHGYFKYIQPITLLQVLLQPVIESLIHADRQAWLLERGFHSNMVPIFDDLISPRNSALIAIKS